MTNTAKIATIVAAIAGLSGTAACSHPQPVQSEPSASVESWSPPLTSTTNAAGHTVSLQTAQTSERSKCWKLTESDDKASAVGSVSACHGVPGTGASRILGIVIVVSPCTDSSTVMIRTSPKTSTTRDAFDGTFLVPPTAADENASTITYACIGSNNEPGPFQTINIAK